MADGSLSERLRKVADTVDRRLVEIEDPHERLASIAIMMDLRDGANINDALGELLDLIEGGFPQGVNVSLADKVREVRERFTLANSRRESRIG